jgi:hypothetical protein
VGKKPNVFFHATFSKWEAYVNHGGKRHYLGVHKDESCATQAVEKFKRENDIELCGDAPILERTTYLDGALVWLRHGRGHSKWDQVGSVDKRSGYRFAREPNGTKQYLHRLIWILHFGAIPPDLEIDHINGNRSDNRIENLRLVTRSVNLKNKRVLPLNLTSHNGVSKTAGGRFAARLWDNRREITVGTFTTALEASEARKKAMPFFGYHANHGVATP